MALNDITIVRGQGGLGRALDGEDYYSGMLFFNDDAPYYGGRQILSLQQAENFGITNNYSDISASTTTVTITDVGSTGDVAIISQNEPTTGYVTLCNYSIEAGATTDVLQATAIANAINNGTRTHGYSAVASSNDIMITAPKRLGVWLNTYGISLSSTGDLSLSATSWSAGTASMNAICHYHISEYFRLQPNGNLWVYFAEISGNAYNFAELGYMQGLAQGKVRQVGVYIANTGANVVSDITAVAGGIQAQCNTLESLHQPMSVVAALDMYDTNATSLVDLGTMDYRSVSITIGQDGRNLGNQLFYSANYSITNMGAVLGAISLAAVNESIAWVSKFNMTNGIELSTPALANGDIIDMVGNANLLSQLNLYRYLFLRTFVGISGTFINDNPCAITESSDYAYINDNRVIDKAHRLLYAGVLPFLNGTIRLNADGTLTLVTISYVQGLAQNALDAMVRAGEISAYQILIDPAQDVLTTSMLYITANIVPTGVARHITINLGFVTSI